MSGFKRERPQSNVPVTPVVIPGVPLPDQSVFEPREPTPATERAKKLLKAAPAWMKRHRDELRELAAQCTVAADALDAQIGSSEESE